MIQDGYFYSIVALLTIGTVFIRGSFIAFSGKMNLTAKTKDLFTYIPAAILPALILPASFHQPTSDRFLVLLVAIFAGFFVRNTLFIISLGLALLYFITH